MRSENLVLSRSSRYASIVLVLICSPALSQVTSSQKAVIEQARNAYQNLETDLQEYSIQFEANYSDAKANVRLVHVGTEIRATADILQGLLSVPQIGTPNRVEFSWSNQRSHAFYQDGLLLRRGFTPQPELLDLMPALPRRWILGVNSSPLDWKNVLDLSRELPPGVKSEWTVEDLGGGEWKLNKRLGKGTMTILVDESIGFLVREYRQSNSPTANVRGFYEWESNADGQIHPKFGAYFTDPVGEEGSKSPQFSWKIISFSRDVDENTAFDLNEYAETPGVILETIGKEKKEVSGGDTASAKLQKNLTRSSRILRASPVFRGMAR